MQVFVDASLAGDLDERRSLTRYVFTLFGCGISWKASIQSVALLSTIEAEFFLNCGSELLLLGVAHSV